LLVEYKFIIENEIKLKKLSSFFNMRKKEKI